MPQAVAAPRPLSKLAAAIRRIRKDGGKTMVEFAREFGVRHSAISRWESGTSVPATIALLQLFAKATNQFERDAILFAIDEQSSGELLLRDLHKAVKTASEAFKHSQAGGGGGREPAVAAKSLEGSAEALVAMRAKDWYETRVLVSEFIDAPDEAKVSAIQARLEAHLRFALAVTQTVDKGRQ